MKKTLFAVAFALCTFSMFAQGTVIFTLNSGTILNAPVYGLEPGNPSLSKMGNTSGGIPAGTQAYNGTLLSGSGYLAQVLSAPTSTGDWFLESALTPAATFRTGNQAGYIGQMTATLANIPKDAPDAFIRVCAWDNSSGLYPTFELAMGAWQVGEIAAGMSPLLRVQSIGGDVNPPPLLIGLESFNIYYVPEPSIITIAGLGAGAFGIRILRVGRTAESGSCSGRRNRASGVPDRQRSASAEERRSA